MKLPLIRDSREQEIEELAKEFKRNRDRDIASLFARRYFVIADKHGKEIETLPKRSFEGLDGLINTGYREEP